MKIKIITIIITIIILLPLAGLAQLDLNLEGLFNDDILNVGSDVVIEDLELIWSGDAYTPFRYDGRSLPSQGTKVTVEAVVKASVGNPDSLKYSWFLEDIFQGNKSGYGRNSFYFYVNKMPGSYHTVKLQIFNEDRTVFEERSVKIPITEPEIVVYFSDGTSYFSDQATKVSVISPDKKFSFIAKPYFFNIKKLTDLTFEWQFAKQEPLISSAYDANVLDLTIKGKSDKEILESNLWLSVNNKNDPQQKAFQNIKVQIR